MKLKELREAVEEQNANQQHTQKELEHAKFLKKKSEQPPTKGMSHAEKVDKGWARDVGISKK